MTTGAVSVVDSVMPLALLISWQSFEKIHKSHYWDYQEIFVIESGLYTIAKCQCGESPTLPKTHFGTFKENLCNSAIHTVWSTESATTRIGNSGELIQVCENIREFEARMEKV